MKSAPLFIWLSILIVPLAILAAGMGLFWQDAGEAYPFQTLRGETVMIRGQGLYRYDTVNSSAQEMGTDAVTLFLGIPLLLTGIVLTLRGSLRGRLLLTGGLGYFLYTYASMSFLTAFNALFLVYVALFSLSLFAFILSLSGLNPLEVQKRISSRFPRRVIAIYFLVVAAFLLLAWTSLVLPASISGMPPAGLESAITMVIQALDLGVIVPTAVATAILLFQQRAWGYTLSAVMLLKILTMGAALIAMIIGQLLAGVAVDAVTSIIFALISLSGMVFSIITLRSVQ